MYFVSYVVVTLLSLCIDALLLAMLISALASWFVPESRNPVLSFINALTDAVVAPVRRLLEKVEFIRGFPLDLSFYLTGVILLSVRSLLDLL